MSVAAQAAFQLKCDHGQDAPHYYYPESEWLGGARDVRWCIGPANTEYYLYCVSSPTANRRRREGDV